MGLLSLSSLLRFHSFLGLWGLLSRLSLLALFNLQPLEEFAFMRYSLQPPSPFDRLLCPK